MQEEYCPPCSKSLGQGGPTMVGVPTLAEGVPTLAGEGTYLGWGVPTWLGAYLSWPGGTYLGLGGALTLAWGYLP